MIAVDTNVLVYAHREELREHESARERLVRLAEGREPWALPVFCLGEFLRVITHPRLFDPPHTVDEACRALERLLESPTLRVLYPGDRFWPLLAEVAREGDTQGNLAFDAQIVAVCLEHGVSTLLTQDRDFDRFRKIRTVRL
ncbi:MAG: ribonuclease VapC43 [Candidatus Binatia bacterium]|nr:MAG: ribonuclease VapC43 [Candidatus Binatia bacterium]